MLKLTAAVFPDGTEVLGDKRDRHRATREFISQIHSIKRLVLPSGKVAFDAERTSRGHADRFWAMALVCQKERGQSRNGTAIAVRVIG